MTSGYHSDSGSQKRMAILLVALMIFLPWSAYSSSDLDNDIDTRYSIPGAWDSIPFIYRADHLPMMLSDM